MSGPQVEDGYTRIANELLDAILRYPFSKRELNIVFAVIRKTYGWNKKRDIISLSQFQNLTGIDRTHIHKTINDLVARKVLLKQPTHKGQDVELNKHYGQWKGGPKQPIGQNVERVGQNSLLKGRPKQLTTKDTTKDTNKRQTPLPPWLDLVAWNEFVQHRKDIRKPLTQLATTKNLKVLEAHQGQQKEIIDKTIANRWTGLFPPDNKGQSNGKNRKLSAVERVEQANNLSRNTEPIDVTPLKPAVGQND